jgi:hypothetical protein
MVDTAQMRRLLVLACLAALALAFPGWASASGYPDPAYAGHYSGETSNILFGPARLQFELGEPDLSLDTVVSDFACGCGVGLPWHATLDRYEFEAKSIDWATPAYSYLEGRVRSATRLDGTGRGGGPWGRLEWTWSAEWVPDLAAAEPDVVALADLSSQADGALSDMGERGEAPPMDTGERGPPRDVGRLDGAIGELGERFEGDARQTAAAEGLASPAPYGAPAGASVELRTRISQWAKDAERAGRRLDRRVTALRSLLARGARGHGGNTRRIRALSRALARRAARIREDVH